MLIKQERSAGRKDKAVLPTCGYKAAPSGEQAAQSCEDTLDVLCAASGALGMFVSLVTFTNKEVGWVAGDLSETDRHRARRIDTELGVSLTLQTLL